MVKFYRQLGIESPSISRRSRRKRFRGRKKSLKRGMKTQQAETTKKRRRNNDRKPRMSKENWKASRLHAEGINSVPASGRVLRSMKINNSRLERNGKKAGVEGSKFAVEQTLENRANSVPEEQKGLKVAPQPDLREMDPINIPCDELKNCPFYIIDAANETIPKSDTQAASLDEANETIPKSDTQAAPLDKANETIPKSDTQAAVLDKANEAIPKSDTQAALLDEANETILKSNTQAVLLDKANETILKSNTQAALLDKANETILNSNTQTVLMDKANEAIPKSDTQAALMDKAKETVLKSNTQDALLDNANETILKSNTQTALLDKPNETEIKSNSDAARFDAPPSISFSKPDSIQADDSLIVLDETGDTTLFFFDAVPELPITSTEQGTKRKSSEMESPQLKITPQIAQPSAKKKRRKKKSIKPIECITLDSDSDTSDVILIPHEITTIELSDDESRSPCRNILLNPPNATQAAPCLLPLPYLPFSKDLIPPKKKARPRKSPKQIKKKTNGPPASKKLPLSDPPLPKKAAPVTPLVGKPRPIAIDGANVAFGHGQRRKFSSEGIKICIDYFLARGHTTVKVFVPQFRKFHVQTTNCKLLQDLEDQGHVVFTPSRRVENKLIVSYEDRMILDYAAQSGAVVVTRDNYKDLFDEKPEWADAIKQRLLMYTWVDDIIMFPDDPMGKSGPSLDVFLHFPPEVDAKTDQN